MAGGDGDDDDNDKNNDYNDNGDFIDLQCAIFSSICLL